MQAAPGTRIALQVPAIAYGNKQWHRHPQDERVAVGSFASGPCKDYLLRLLCDWWAPPHAYLLRRRAADWLHEHSAWHPEMPCAQDREYFTTAACAGWRFLHTPGANAVYHTRGNQQISRRTSAATRAAALAAMQHRLARRKRLAGVRAPDAVHRFLLQQDRRLWRAAAEPAGLRDRTAAAVLATVIASGTADMLEQHAKNVAWAVPPLWQQHIAILQALHRLAASGALQPVDGR